MNPILRQGADWLEVELASPRRVLRLELDPRDFSDVEYVDASLWTEPANQPMLPAEFEQVLDTIYGGAKGTVPLLQHQQGFDLLLRAAPGHALVGTTWTGHDTGYVTLLELGRTYRVAVTLSFSRGFAVARLLREHARCLHPEIAELNDAEWQTVCDRLVSLGKPSFYRDYWRLERAPSQK
jgi:hypothetical protein